MYFPYLRGKQFELIALRELSQLLARNPLKISPIIEPVKDSSTLRSTLKELTSKDINFSIIVNPGVGDFNSINEIIQIIQSSIDGHDNFQLGIIIDEKTNVLIAYRNLMRLVNFDFKGLTFIHNAIKSDISDLINEIEANTPVINNLIYFKKTSRRYYREFKLETRIGLDDYFASQKKNADYLAVPDSQFTEEHLFFEEDGYKGFSDFLTIGDIYSESGFLPYAVAIHLSYVEPQNNKIRVKHFVSDSNEDSSDIGGKFAEALDKLIEWCNANPQNTQAEIQFKQLHENGHFPGLGSIKKLSIIQHIEVILNLI